MKLKLFPSSVACVAVSMALIACGAESSSEADSVVESDDDAGSETPDPNELDEGDDESEPEGEGGGEPDAGELTLDSASRATPEDVSLDVTGRHPGGTVVSVSEVTFDDTEIRVTGEFINGSRGDVRIRLGGGNALRLVDDLGSVYNFVVPDELRDRHLELEQGESVSGDFVFVGPVVEDASILTLVANTRQGNPVVSDMDNHRSGSSSPVLVIDGIDLSW